MTIIRAREKQLSKEVETLSTIITDLLRAHKAIRVLHRDAMEHRDYASVIRRAEHATFANSRM